MDGYAWWAKGGDVKERAANEGNVPCPLPIFRADRLMVTWNYRNPNFVGAEI